jgi:hypothetical protein
MTRDLGPYTPDRHTAVQVIEIMPPGVQTGLRDERVNEPDAMPLDEYIAETMALLTEEPEATEIVVDATNRSGSPNRRRVRAALYRLQHVTLALTGVAAASAAVRHIRHCPSDHKDCKVAELGGGGSDSGGRRLGFRNPARAR